MSFKLSENSPKRLVDLFQSFHDDKPDALYLHALDIDNEDGEAIPKTRRDLLNDARSIASRLLRCGGVVRQQGESLIKCSILARSGYLYFAHFLGAILNGWTPVLLSTRNSAEAIEQLIRISESRHLIIDEAFQTSITEMREKIPDVVIHVMESSGTPQCAAEEPKWKAWTDEEVEAEIDFPGWYLHTSGSTGHPKLIPLSHKQIFRRIFDLSRTRYDNHFIIGTTPMFHTIGLLVVAMWPMSTGATSVVLESKHPITGEAFLGVLRRYPQSLAMVPPAILDEVVTLGSEAMDVVSNAHRIVYGGAALSQETGDTLAQFGVKIVTAFGTTETGGLSLMDVASDDPRDWRYTRFLSQTEIVMKPSLESPDLRQMIIRPGTYVSSSLVNSEDPVGFITGDLWKEHPTKSGLWLHMGRRGSVTVLSTGEKTDNVQIESMLMKDPLISGAAVFGEGRAQNGVIVLPKDPVTDTNKFLTAIWPTIENINTVIPQHSRLTRTLVLVTDPTKGFAFTDKSTIDRKRTIELYDEEINAAYAAIDAGVTAYELPHNADETSVLNYTRRVVFGILGKTVDDDVDLFDEGMDSLSVITCRSSLIPLVELVRPSSHVPHNLMYHYPTISSLARYICSSQSLSLSGDGGTNSLDDIIEKLTEDLPTRYVELSSDIGSSDSGLVVVLTGSTGSFGGHILSELLQDYRVMHVFCLNRKSPIPILDRQQRSMDDASLLTTHGSKIDFLDMDLSASALGLSPDIIEKIQTSATHIIHCAWEVNFNHVLDRFVNVQIAGLRRLIDISLSSNRLVPPRFIFISSISAVTCSNSGEAIPEEIVDKCLTPKHQGYGQSKYIAEAILAKASSTARLPVTIIRVGQLSGSSKTGAWNMNEYIPALLQTSLTLGMVPDTIPDLRWIPSDIAAGVIMDILRHDKGSELTVYHVESPFLVPGRQIIDWIAELSEGAVKAIPSGKWLDAVQESSSPLASARRLLDFYHSWLGDEHSKRVLSTEKTAKVSTRVYWGPITKDVFTKYYKRIQRSLSNNL